MLVVVVGFFLFCFVFLFFVFVLFCFVRFFLFFFFFFFFPQVFFFKKCFLEGSVNFPFVGVFNGICGYQIYNLAETKFDKILAKHICCLLFLNYNSV